MAAYSTGKTFTLSASWTITGSIHTDPGVGTGFDPSGTQGEYVTATADIDVNFCNVSGSANVTMQSIVPSEPSDTHTWFANGSASGGEGDYQEGRASTLALNGSASASVPCVLCYEFLGRDGDNPFAGDVVDDPYFRKIRFFLVGTGNATMSISFGPVSDNGTLDVRGMEITPGINAQTAITSQALPYPVASTVFTGYLSSASSVNIALTSCTFSLQDENTSAADNFTQHLDNIPAGTTFSFPVSATASAGNASAASSCTNGGSAQSGSSGGAPRSFELQGVIRAMTGDFPDTLTLTCPRYAGDPMPSFTAPSSFGRSYTQKRYTNYSSAGAHIDGSQAPNSDEKAKDEFCDIEVKITRASLTAIGDESLANRVLMRGKRVDGITLTQAATHLFDDFSAGWTGTDGATVTTSSAGLHIQTSTSAPGGASVGYTTPRSAASYRYIRVPLKSVGAANVPIKIDVEGRVYNLTTGADGETKTVDIDLCAPHVGGLSLGQSDSWDTRWPTPSVTSPTSGPLRVNVVRLSGIPANREVVVGSLLLARHDAPTVDCMPTLYSSKWVPPTDFKPVPRVKPPWPLAMGPERLIAPDAETVSQDFVRRFLLANSDGRQTVEERDFWYTKTEGGATGTVSYSFNMDSLQGLCDAINAQDAAVTGYTEPENDEVFPGTVTRWPGWTATPSVPAPSAPFVPAYPGDLPPENPYYFNAGNLLATEIMGGGILFQPPTEGGIEGSGAAVVYGFDLPIGALSAQPLFDAVSMCGLEGDVFGFAGGVAGPKPGGGGTDPLSLRCGTTLRGGAHGSVLDTKNKPKSGETIIVKQAKAPAALAIVSSGDSRTPDGYYHADNPPAAKAEKDPDGPDPNSDGSDGSDGDDDGGGTPYVPEPDLITTQVIIRVGVSGQIIAEIDKVRSRHRHRFAFMVAALQTLGKGLTGDASMASRMVRGFTGDDGLLRLEFATSTNAAEWIEVETALTAYRACTRYSRLNLVLYVLFQATADGGPIMAAWTRTEGRSFEGMATINSSGEFPTFCILQSGLQCHFWRTDGGAIESKIVSPQLTQVYPAGGAVLTVVASGVAEDALTAWIELATGYVFLSYRNDEGEIVTVRSVDGGKSYS